MNLVVFLTDTANKELRRLSSKDRARIDAGIKEMEENPFEGDMIKLGGEHNRWRRRIGAYRIMYSLVPEKRNIFIYDRTYALQTYSSFPKGGARRAEDFRFR